MITKTNQIEHPHLDKSIIGKKFRKLTVLSFSHYNNKTEISYWMCQCECGIKKAISRTGLMGKTKSCGCLKNKHQNGRTHPRFKDLKGKRFSRLLVISLHSFGKGLTGTKWNCLCDCGKKKIVFGGNLIHNKTKSCGCLAKEITSKVMLINLKGKKFGTYTVIKRVKNKRLSKGKLVDCWQCKCECGTIKYLDGHYIAKNPKEACKKCFGLKMRGKNHPNWNPNLTDEERQLNLTERSSPEYKVWRRSVFKRDNYTCQVTGEKGKICAHHLECFHANKKLRMDLSNGITILRSVHDEFHKKYGSVNNTKRQFNKFIKNLTKAQIKELKNEKTR